MSDINFSLDAIAITHTNNILANALNHNATIIEYASEIIAAGPVKDKRQYRKIVDGYKKIHDQYNAEHIKVLESFEKALGDASN